MGYCIELEEGEIKIKKDNIDKVLKVLSNKDFCWCDKIYYNKDDYIDEDVVINSFELLRYYIKYENGYWIISDFEGEKLGDDEDIFRLISPYCEDGYLQFLGEDGEKWRYVIKDKKFDIKYPTLVWE